MATHIVKNNCASCGQELKANDQAFYLAKCTLVNYGFGGWDGQGTVGRGAGSSELRVKYPGGKGNKHAICIQCIESKLLKIPTPASRLVDADEYFGKKLANGK